jgi:integrase/recombinase XerD
MGGRDVNPNPILGACRETPSIDNLLQRCTGAYAEATLHGYGSDLLIFEAWCAKHHLCWLPAEASAVASFVNTEAELFSASTIRRRIAAINFAHRVADLPSPRSASEVYLALRRAARRHSRRPAQSSGLTAEIRQRIDNALARTQPGLRDAALIGVGYDTLCRSCELAAMRVEHLRRSFGGHWSVLIPRSKSDQAGDGRVAWLSPNTIQRLREWMEVGAIEEGPVFRALHLRRVLDTHMATSSIRRLIKRAAAAAGINEDSRNGLSGHSMRIGAAQDMLVAGFDALAIMQAGGWKTTAVLLR